MPLLTTVYTDTADAPPPTTSATAPAAQRRTLGARVRAWARDTLLPHPAPADGLAGDPERSARLLTDLNRAVAEAPDDVPLRETIDRLNHPYSD